MSIVLIIIVIAVLLAGLFVAVPRLRGGLTRGSHARRPGAQPRPRRAREERSRDERYDSREERQLIAEGEAIREHVEARLRRERRVAPVRLDPVPIDSDPEIAGRLHAQELPLSQEAERELQEIAAASRGRNGRRRRAARDRPDDRLTP